MDSLVFDSTTKKYHKYSFLYGSSIQFFDNYALISRSNGAICEYINNGDVLLLRCRCADNRYVSAALYIETKSGTHKIFFDMDTMYSSVMRCVFRLRSFCSYHDTGTLFDDTSGISQMFWKNCGGILKNFDRLNRNYFLLDIKTTGTSLESDDIYAIRLTECIGRKVSRVFESYINLDDAFLATKEGIPAQDYHQICQALPEEVVVDDYYNFVCKAEGLHGYSENLFILNNAKDKFSFVNRLLHRNHKSISGSYIDFTSMEIVDDSVLALELQSFYRFFNSNKLAV